MTAECNEAIRQKDIALANDNRSISTLCVYPLITKPRLLQRLVRDVVSQNKAEFNSRTTLIEPSDDSSSLLPAISTLVSRETRHLIPLCITYE